MSHSPEAELLLAKEIIGLDRRDKNHIPRGEVETHNESTPSARQSVMESREEAYNELKAEYNKLERLSCNREQAIQFLINELTSRKHPTSHPSCQGVAGNILRSWDEFRRDRVL